MTGESDWRIATKARLRRHCIATQAGSKIRVLWINVIRRVPIRKTWSVTPIRIGKWRSRGKVWRVRVVDGEETNPQEILEECIDAVQGATRTAAHDSELALAYDNTMFFGSQVGGAHVREAPAQRGAGSNVNVVR